MNHSGPRASAVAIALLLTLPACGGGSSGGGSGSMYITTCSLGCGSGATSNQVNCTIVRSALNSEIAVLFSEPIAPSSVSPASFHLIDAFSGQAPAGTRLIDPNDPRKLIFRPAITFDAQGNTIFGFSPGETYRITLQGTGHGDAGPFIRSVNGHSNRSRMQCDIQTTTDIIDLVEGPPVATVLVQLAIPGDPDNGTDPETANGAVDVWRNSPIIFRFNDIMNPVTLLNPSTHQASLITIEVDSDGNTLTSSDRVPLIGTYFLDIDLAQLKTELIFTPSNGMPSAGESPSQTLPRKVIVTIPTTVQDIARNGVANPGQFIFTPELVHYPALVFPDANGEDFTNTQNEDLANSGADWGQGRLTRGWGGGTGRLGGVHVPTPQTLVLDTDGTEFRHQSMPDFPPTLPLVRTSGFLDNSRPTLSPGGPETYSARDRLTWPRVTVTDGIFEFSSVYVEPGAVLRVVGLQHARIFSSGPVEILGRIDVRGETPEPHHSDELFGGSGAAGGPAGGDGGKGGDRYDYGNNGEILSLGGVDVPDPNSPRGVKGGGIGRFGTRGGGGGAAQFPDPGPSTFCPGDNTADGGLLYSDPGPDTLGNEGFCTCRQVASPGGGGAYATSGQNGQPNSSVLDAIWPTPPPDSVSTLSPALARGGDASVLGIEPPDPESGHRVRKLDAVRNLRGGSGGGGGGAQLFDSFMDGFPTSGGCYSCSFGAGLTTLIDHSAAGGGGGGGALQIVSGALIHVTGTVDAKGGDGGSGFFSTIPSFQRGGRSSPGGGGSGGAVRLQARSLNLPPIDPNNPNALPHVDVRGGQGGISYGRYVETISEIGRGGTGGGGLIRLEDLSGGTTPPATVLTRCSEGAKVAPYDPAHPCGEAILSVGAWDPPTLRPETFSSATSCWMKATGNYFTLDFAVDDLAATPPFYAWNMDVVFHDSVSGQDVLTTYRGRDQNTPFGTGDFESNLGSAVNYTNSVDPPGNQYGTGPVAAGTAGSYMAVRFQGAVSLGDISSDPCHVTLSGTSSEIALGTLTPWVRHPSELNRFLPKPNMIRFCVVFDKAVATSGSISAQINGVTNLRIHAKPD